MTDEHEPHDVEAGSGVSPQPRFLTAETPPEHGPSFWSDLERSMATDTAAPTPIVRVPTNVAAESNTATRPRPWALLAVAATALVLVGVAAIALRSGDRGASVTTDLAVDSPNDVAPALDGSDDAGSEGDVVADTAPSPSPTGAATAVAAQTSAPRTVADFPLALGAEADTFYPPYVGGLPTDARFLATWQSRRLSWYAVADATRSCSDPAYAEISYVNEPRIPQAVHDPQIRFSGDISHFVVDAAEQRAAWLASCDTQLEFYVGRLATNGELEEAKLVWFGDGEPAGALIVWQSQTASLNFVDTDGVPVFVDYDTRTELASGSGINPAPSEPGTPPGRGSIPLAASGDALFSYWSAPTRSFADASSGADGCDTEALWVRQPGPQWTVAVDDLELRSIDAVALSTDASRIAFADRSCDGRDGRLFVGVPGGDGLIRDIAAIDLSPYVPGFADRLFWVDPTTLRIETDNRSLGVERVRFDYRLGDGTEPGILLQLD